MFVPLSDTMPCCKFVGTAIYERLDSGIQAFLDNAHARGFISDDELELLDDMSSHQRIDTYEEGY